MSSPARSAAAKIVALARPELEPGSPPYRALLESVGRIVLDAIEAAKVKRAEEDQPGYLKPYQPPPPPAKRATAPLRIPPAPPPPPGRPLLEGDDGA